MNKDIKAYVDNRDIDTLRYVFSQSLDIDPTFEDYREEYDYCIKNNVFDIHSDSGFTPLRMDKSRWDREYWIHLCLDLKKNMSKERLDHMIEVAKVVHSDKIGRLKAASSVQVEEYNSPTQNKFDSSNQFETRADIQKRSAEMLAQEERGKVEVVEARRKLAEENRRIEEGSNGGNKSKKVYGESVQKEKKNQGMNWVAVTVGIMIIATIAYLVKR